MIVNRFLTLAPRIRAIKPLVLCCQQPDYDSGGKVENILPTELSGCAIIRVQCTQNSGKWHWVSWCELD